MAADSEGDVTVAAGSGPPAEPPGGGHDAEQGAPGNQTRRQRGNLYRVVEWVAVIVVALVAALLIRTFVIQPFSIPSGSMEPTLIPHDRVLVNKLSYDLHSVRRGDVVVFKTPADDFDPGVADLIKRVIGLPGETILLDHRQIYIDGKFLDQKWLPAEGILDPGPVITNLGCANRGPRVNYCVIPKGDYYVMGDNRDDSDDSRFFGPIAGKLIVGRAFLIAWPLGRIRTL